MLFRLRLTLCKYKGDFYLTKKQVFYQYLKQKILKNN